MIGVSCTQFACEQPQVWLDRIVGNFDLWEIFSEADHSISKHKDLFKELLPSYDLNYSVHAPICDINISSLSDRIREASLKEMLSTIMAANELDIGLVTVHPGLSSMVVNGLEGRAMELANGVMHALDKAAQEYGVTLAIENMPNVPFFLGRTADALAAVIDGTDLSICFDVGHANTMDQIGRMIDLLGDRFANIHIHDNYGEKDEHLTIGDGDIDYVDVFGKLSSYQGNFIIESKNFESAVESQNRISEMLE